MENWGGECITTVPAQVVEDENQECSSSDSSDDELSDWTEDDSDGWYDEEEELILDLDEENEINDSGYGGKYPGQDE
ncbi:13667_t:CDS:2 [Gigaspora rosea]|nr:13667_t:CDS:2 [Gigaspora rosea]